MENKTCPFCGETILATAKKCRFCGEWLESEAMPAAQPKFETAEPIKPVAINTSESNPAELPVVTPESNVAVNPSANNVTPKANFQQAGAPAAMPQINIQLNQQISQEQTVIQETTTQVVEKEETSTGFLMFQIGCIAIGIWIAFTWWWALIGFVVMLILLYIPVIGHIMSVILGIGIGAIAAAIALALNAPDWAAWVIGGVVGLGAIAVNIEQRKAFTED